MTVWERARTICGWRIGAKRISIDATIPIFAIPILAVIAAQAAYLTVLAFLVTPMLVYHLHHNFLRFLPRSKFFLVWTITSVVALGLVFELSVVPLLEILPEENFVFVVSVVGGACCGYKTRTNADRCVADDNDAAAGDSRNAGGTPHQGLELGEGSGEICSACRRRVPLKAGHCLTCQTCVLGREYHCQWLDCCVGSSNLKWYMSCLFFSSLAFVYGSNLTATSVCHPFVLIGSILLPDDCGDVYRQLDLALCFVSALYSLLIGLVLLCYFVYHVWLLYLGTTSSERRSSTNGNGRYAHVILKSISRLFRRKT